jgi:hypothetical protein
LQQAVYTQMKYQGIYRENGIHDLNRKNEVSLPDLEVIRAKIMENKPDIRAINSKQFEYYAELATLDFKTDTPVKVMRSMIAEMQQDGLSQKKINNIIKTNKNFDLSLMENNEKVTTMKKRKLQVTMRTSNSQERGMGR